MSEKGLKCKRAEFQPTADSVVCNVSNNEIINIKMSDRPIEDHMIRSFRERNLILEKENRWTIDFEYGRSHFVVYFTEESANRFVEEVNRSFGRPTDQGMGQFRE